MLQYRQRLHVPGKGVLNHMAAADLTTGYMGLKIYSISRGGARFLVTLFSAESGELVALIEADYLGQMRTGAASGVATRFMARQDARVAAIIGTGLQARTQLEAIAAVRKLESIRAFGRDPGRRETFAREMTPALGVPVTPVSSAEEAVRGAQIVTTCTTSKVPVLEGRWIEPGMHINAVGVNQAQKRELDAEAVLRCDVIAADSREQSKIEAGDLIQAFAGDACRWESVRELCGHRRRKNSRAHRARLRSHFSNRMESPRRTSWWRDESMKLPGSEIGKAECRCGRTKRDRSRSAAFERARSGLHAPQALLEGHVQSLARVGGEGNWFGVAEDFDGLFRGVYDNAAVLALGQMLFNFDSKRRVEHLVEIIRELRQQSFALHEFSPRRKYRFSF